MQNKLKLKYALIPMIAILVGCGSDEPAPKSGDKPVPPPQSEAPVPLDCVPVAKIYKQDNINQVSIRQNGKTVGLASRPNKELCADDQVIVPNTLQEIKIEYYSYPPKKVRVGAGESYQVVALSDPCGVLCKLNDNIKDLANQLTTGEQEELTVTADRGGDDEQDWPIFMSLAAAQEQNTPFYLFSRGGAVELFWAGKQPPYQLEVTDERGQKIVQQTVKTNTFSLTLPNTEPNQRYLLRISEKGGNEVYQKQLVFAVPPFPQDPKADPYQMFATLLAADCGDNAQNWRLEIWRQLHQLPNNRKKENFKAHLAADDFELSEVGLCK
jgi:hypothetical protein